MTTLQNMFSSEFLNVFFFLEKKKGTSISYESSFEHTSCGSFTNSRNIFDKLMALSCWKLEVVTSKRRCLIIYHGLFIFHYMYFFCGLSRFASHQSRDLPQVTLWGILKSKDTPYFFFILFNNKPLKRLNTSFLNLWL